MISPNGSIVSASLSGLSRGSAERSFFRLATLTCAPSSTARLATLAQALSASVWAVATWSGSITGRPSSSTSSTGSTRPGNGFAAAGSAARFFLWARTTHGSS